MIAKTLQRAHLWFSIGAYTDPVQRQRAFATYLIALLFMVSAPLAILPALLIALARNTMTASLIVSITLVTSLVYGSAIAAINATRAGRQPIGSMLLLGTWFIITAVALLSLLPPIDGLGIFVILMLVFGIALPALLAGARSLIFGTLFAIVGLIVFAIRIRLPGAPEDELSTLIPFMSVLLPAFIAYALTYWLFQRGLNEATQRANLASARRLDLAQASTLLVERILSRTEQEKLQQDIVDLVQQTFQGIDTASLWLMDSDRRNVIRVTSTLKTAQLGEKIGVGTLHAIGRVAIAGHVLVVRNVPEETAYRRNALPKGVESQLLLPLKVATDTIGILELQSSIVNGFERADIEALQRMADQIAVGIDNARLFAAAQNSLNENKRLYEQTRANFREIERLNQQLTGQSWSEYLRARPASVSHTMDFASAVADEYADWTASLNEAAQQKRIVVSANAQGQIVSFPIAVRGQVIGAMEFELDADQVIEPERLEAVGEAINRMALSAENIRLFDEAQRIAQREAMVNEISERMQGSTSVEITVGAAAQGLASVLRTSRVAIRIGTPHITEPVRGNT